MLILFRGLPGSGKSTAAYRYADIFNTVFAPCDGGAQAYSCDAVQDEYVVCAAADDYFYDEDGNYVFVAKDIPLAHQDCQERTRLALSQGLHVVVHNTFTQVWEMQPYLDMAKELNVPMVVVEFHNNYGNIHGVPAEALQRMKDRWEAAPPGVTVMDLRGLYEPIVRRMMDNLK